MVGGYLSFQGIEAKAKYKDTVIEEILPVTLYEGDDRREVPSGTKAKIIESEHPCLRDVPKDWPKLLGYNMLKMRDDAHMLVECNGDPMLSVREVNKGRTVAFASDCGPHWAPPDFVEWKGIADWACGKI